jgi:hypothetical protein
MIIRFTRLTALTLLSMFLAWMEPSAQTGMCLVVDQGQKGYFLEGGIRRIDMKDGQIVFTSGVLVSNGLCPRFSPDGSGFAFTRGANTFVVCDVNGQQRGSFSCDGKYLSWTNSGIWIHPAGTGKWVLHDPQTGAQVRTVDIDGLESHAAYVAQNETAIGMHYKTTDGNSAGAILLDEANRIVPFGPGCSVGASPDGTLFTNNLWETGIEHQSMKIWKRDGSEYLYLKLWEIIDFPQDGYSWNDQTWSGNSNDHIILPAGKKGADQYQQYGSTVPWIYNIRTGESFCFHADKEADVFWFPYDYYDGKIAEMEDPAATVLRLEPGSVILGPGESVVFEAQVLDQYGRPFAQAQPVQLRVSGGGTLSGATFTAGAVTGGPWTLTAVSGPLEQTATIEIALKIKRINCGTNGTQYDAEGWEQDDPYIVGHTATNDYNWTAAISIEGVAGAAPPNVYKSVYHLDHRYDIPGIPDGVYTLRFHFADQNVSSGRAMSYTADGVTVLSDFSISAEAGGSKAFIKNIVVTVKDNDGLQIECSKGPGNDVFECGLEVLQIGNETQEVPLRLLYPLGGEVFAPGQAITISWEGDPEKIILVNVFLSVDGGKKWVQLNDASIGLDRQNRGTFAWTVGPVTAAEGTITPEGDNIKIKVAEYTNPCQDISGVFSIAQSSGAMPRRDRARCLKNRLGTAVSIYNIAAVEIVSCDGKKMAAVPAGPFNRRSLAADRVASGVRIAVLKDRAGAKKGPAVLAPVGLK